jgi:hypothetical protein
MKTHLQALLAVICLAIILLFGCSKAEYNSPISTNTPDVAANSPSAVSSTTEEEAKALVTELVPQMAKLNREVFNGSGYFKVDETVTIPDFPNYVLVVDETITSVADLKAMVEAIVTPEIADICYYQKYLKDLDLPLDTFDRNEYTPSYYDFEGKLYVDQYNGGKGFPFEWRPDTITITSITESTITAEIIRISHIDATPDVTDTVVLEKRGAHWLIANDFIDKLDER